MDPEQCLLHFTMIYRGYGVGYFQATKVSISLSFLLTVHIPCKLNLVLMQLLAIRLQHNFAHGTTAQLLCHVQNYVAITLLES